MVKNFKDLAVQNVKTIVDCNRCSLCDRTDGARMRFTCGHSACVDCVAVACECPICTPLMDASSKPPQSDVPQTERVKLATELLTTFQDAFDIDVYERQRISERLKVEKELFPECIQAPVKYFNKRKSLNLSPKNKENRYTFLPGEGISSKRESTMNKSSYVQDWLKKQTTPSSAPSRSPFSDLQVNTYHNSPATKHTSIKGKGKQNVINQPTRQSNRKRSRLKQSLTSNSQSCLENYLKPVEKSQSKNTWMSTKRLKKAFSENTKSPWTDKVQHRVDKNHCDESGIVIDDDCFMIEDTQDQVLDKDRLALLAVANADANATSSSFVEVEDSHGMHDVNLEKNSSPAFKEQKNAMNKVPFYRKSYLFENCHYCNENKTVNLNIPKLCDESSKKDTNISITVENKSFITTITVVDCHQVGSDKKQATSVQTYTEEPFLGFEQETRKDETVNIISKIQEYIQSETMFTEGNISDSQKTRCTEVMLTNNDAENNSAIRNMLVDSRSENGVLTESGAGSRNRKRKAPRGVTPDSTNSSDKENCDPNRKKKCDGKKKKKPHK